MEERGKKLPSLPLPSFPSLHLLLKYQISTYSPHYRHVAGVADWSRIGRDTLRATNCILGYLTEAGMYVCIGLYWYVGYFTGE